MGRTALRAALMGALCAATAYAALRSTTKEADYGLGSSTTSGDYVRCQVGSTVGDCTDATQCTENGGTATPGYCPGPAAIQCCTHSNWGSCIVNGQSGFCTGADACIAAGKTAISGYCPGPRDVQCCVGASPAPSNGSVAAMMQFAAATWNCDGSSPPCVGCAKVGEGSAQTPYGCAPWVAQVLATGGYVPGHTGCTDEGDFGDVDGYNLNWVGCDGTGLVDYLQKVGWRATSSITQGTVCAVFGCGHAVLGVGNGLCAAHNNARWAVNCADNYGVPNICLNPP